MITLRATLLSSLVFFVGCGACCWGQSNEQQLNRELQKEFAMVKMGMPKAAVLAIFDGQPILEGHEGKELHFGSPVKLWSHQSPATFGGRILITFDASDRVSGKKYYEDYDGVPWEKGYVDTRDLFDRSADLRESESTLRPRPKNASCGA